MTHDKKGKIIASVQVRMGSSRLPGKVMKEINSKPLIGHLIDRLSLSKLLDGIVIATSTSAENDIIEEYCISRNVNCYRGSEDDVLDRTLKALLSTGATIGVEVFGDCPLIDPSIVDDMITSFLESKEKLDFVSNDLLTTYPPGMEVEVFNVEALQDAWNRVNDMSIREHGTLYIRKNPDIYKIKNIEAPPDFHLPDLELEVDTEEDFIVVSKILEYFRSKPNFSLTDIILYLKSNPELAEINKTIPRRWKEFREEKDA